MRKVLLLVFLLVFIHPALAQQQWPTRPIHIVVPYPPGGGNDVLARLFAPELSQILGQSVIVENRPGAGGSMGSASVARSAPDGYTLLIINTIPHTAAVGIYPKLPYDPVKDFSAVALVASNPYVIAVNPKLPVKNITELIALARSKPGTIYYGSAGTGSVTHLNTELLKSVVKIDLIHVPYKGGGPAITDAIGGQLDALFANVNSVIQYINAGKLRPLAIAGTKRSPVLPNVPTFAELGYKDVVAYGWQAVVAPKGLPADVKDKVYKSVIAALNDPQVKKNFVDLGYEIVANTPEQFVQYQAQENARWKKLIESRQITAN